MQKQIYTQSLWKVKYILLAGLLGFIWLSGFLFHVPNPNEPDSAGILNIFLISAIAVSLISMLIIWLTMKKCTVAVDLVGCEITTKRPFGQAETKRFEWKNVTSTSIYSQSYYGEGGKVVEHTFKVSIKKRSFDLITRGTVSRQDLVKLMAAVNAATPHLSYFWEERWAKETRNILNEVPPYCKISRS
jgi:hypothetical protein